MPALSLYYQLPIGMGWGAEIRIGSQFTVGSDHEVILQTLRQTLPRNHRIVGKRAARQTIHGIQAFKAWFVGRKRTLPERPAVGEL